MIFTKQMQRTTHWIYSMVVLALMSGAFLPFFIDPDNFAELNDGSPMLKTVWAIVYVISIIRLLRRRREASALIRANKALFFILVLASASALWSIEPSVTLHSAISLACSALFALDLTITYSVREQLRLTCTALVLVLLMSVLVEVCLPGIVRGGDVDSPGAWHGVFGRKNGLGRITCLGCTACLTLVWSSKWLRTLVVLGGVALAFASKSVSAVGYIAIMGIIVSMLSILRWAPKPRRIAICAIAVIVPIAIYAVAENFTQITTMMDKDPHLTGRVDLWELSLADIAKRPVLGYGYDAFWTPDSQPARRIREEMNWDDTPHSHNGYIDITLSLGLAGLTGFLVLFGTVVKRAFAFMLDGLENYKRWPLAYLAFVLLYQLTETTQVAGNNLLWVLLCCLAFSLPAQEDSVPVHGMVESPILQT